jgi:hypothetical protein
MPTNFDLAPPGTVVDGLGAVPIDIQTITASLTFDGATSSGTGDATLDFIVGPGGGCPIFDLRQTLTGVWLDGAAIPLAQAAHHDFGGGAGAELRVVESILADGSAHTLRVTYNLGPPQASGAGSYRPAMAWSAGPRLAFNFGFTDLGPGRYLEAWIPANLIFDQFTLILDLTLLNTAVPHTVITNGAVTTLGAGHWRVAYPAHFTAHSPMLELRATNTLRSMTGSTTLPASGRTVTIEAWKLASSGIDLNAEIAHLSTWLAENEVSSGAYLHDERFVAFLNVGGMEYNGGTTSGVGALRHETFHSWFGRGVMPASQPDAWWDEAWNTYHDLGATGAIPLDFTDPPVELSSRIPWRRVTPGTSYSRGEELFEGIAALTGVASLKTHMAAFYGERHQRPATTTDLETFLLGRAGAPGIVDAFHRFVYGFADPSPAPDLAILDDPGDPGANLWSGRFWDSQDLWIRNVDDGGTTHQPVEFGQDNFFYARVRNRSATTTARHFVVTFNVKPWAGTQFVYPADFLPCIVATAGFDLEPGESTIVSARWPASLIPPPGMHACWLAAVLTRSDHPAGGAHVWTSNNLAQKNLAIVDLSPGDVFVLPFVIDRLERSRARRATLELVHPRRGPHLEAELLHPSPKVFAVDRKDKLEIMPPAKRTARADVVPAPNLDCAGHATPRQPIVERFERSFSVAFSAGNNRLPIWLRGAGQTMLGLRLRVPEDAKPGDRVRIDLVHREGRDERITGGLAVEVRVRRRARESKETRHTDAGA